jgi:hypothetical protein
VNRTYSSTARSLLSSNQFHGMVIKKPHKAKNSRG